MSNYVLIVTYWPKNCSYADASGAGKDVYEFVSLRYGWIVWSFAFIYNVQLLLFLMIVVVVAVVMGDIGVVTTLGSRMGSDFFKTK